MAQSEATTSRLKDEANHVVVGQIGKPYGVQGWMKVHSFTEPYTNLLDYEPWFIEQRGQWHELTGIKVQEHGNAILLHIEGCDSPEDARRYTNAKIAVVRELFSALDDDEFYWNDLAGLTVINQDDVTLGTVDYIFETGSNDVLVVKGEREHLVPFLYGEVILKVDLTQKVIRVQWDPEF